jgi:hypothetical protein
VLQSPTHLMRCANLVLYPGRLHDGELRHAKEIRFGTWAHSLAWENQFVA